MNNVNLKFSDNIVEFVKKRIRYAFKVYVAVIGYKYLEDPTSDCITFYFGQSPPSIINEWLQNNTNTKNTYHL